jgi:uncharacterized membrane protein YGL010W
VVIVQLLDKINKWANAADWHTWVLHGLISIPIAWVFGPAAAIAVYVMRELEQLGHELIEQKKPKYLDHVMDVVGPLVALGAKWVFHF